MADEIESKENAVEEEGRPNAKIFFTISTAIQENFF